MVAHLGMEMWRACYVWLLLFLTFLHAESNGASNQNCRHEITVEEDCTGGRIRRQFYSRAAVSVAWRDKFGEYPGLLLPYAELKDLELTKGVVGYNNSHAMLLLGMAAFFGVSPSSSLSLTLAQPVNHSPLIFINLMAARHLKVRDLLTVPGEREVAKAPAVPRQEEVCVEQDGEDVAWEPGLFGCDDRDHLSVSPDGFIMTVLGFGEGEVVEVCLRQDLRKDCLCESVLFVVEPCYYH